MWAFCSFNHLHSIMLSLATLLILSIFHYNPNKDPKSNQKVVYLNSELYRQKVEVAHQFAVIC
jgi:hypothetical protein